MNFDIAVKRVFLHLLHKLPYKRKRGIYKLWTKISKAGRASNGGERWVVRSWKELVEVDEFISSYCAQRYYRIAEKLRGKRVLDLGCGVGYGTHYMSQFADEVIGLDCDPQAIKWAKKYFDGPNIKFIEGNALDLSVFNSNYFDVVVCFEVLEHLRSHEIMLPQINRICKEKLYITTPNADPESFRIRELKDVGCFGIDKFHVSELTPSEFKDLMKKHFVNVEIYGEWLKGVYTYEDWYDAKKWWVSMEDIVTLKLSDYKACPVILAECGIYAR